MRAVLSIILIYGIFSTFLYETEIVDDFGKEFGKANLALFGYLAYINLFLLAYLLNKFLSDLKKSLILDSYIGWILLFLSLLIVQPLIVDFRSAGVISLELYKTLISFGGKIGYFFIWILTFFLSLAILVESEEIARELWIEIKKDYENKGENKEKFFFLYIILNLKKILSNPFSSSTSLDKNIIKGRKKGSKSVKAKSRLEREREKLRKAQAKMRKNRRKSVSKKSRSL
jgi:S-DNA-T family DNA segregation ATPase FtsK/SpoIIIE